MVLTKAQLLPNWKEAEIHGHASKVGFYDQESTNVCYCCQQKVQRREIPLCQNTKSLEFLGFGFPLFYMFIRNCIILLLLLIISNNFILLFNSIADGNAYCSTHSGKVAASPHHEPAPHHFLQSQNHENGGGADLYLSQKCKNFFILIANTQITQQPYEVILRICSFIIHVFALLYIKDKIIKTWAYYDEMESDLSDYAVIVKNMPAGTTRVRQRLNDLVKNQTMWQNKKPYEVHEIILIPDSQKVHKLDHEEDHAIQHFLHANSLGEHHLDHHLQEINKIHDEKFGIVQKSIQQINNDSVESRNAIIIFETEPEKEAFLEAIDELEEKGKIGKYFGNPEESIIIEEAPEPREIIYQNLEHSHNKVTNIAIGWGLSLLFLLAITVIFYLLQLVKTNNLVSAIEQMEQNPNSSSAQTGKTIASIIAWVTLFGIVFFNKFVMGNVLHYFTHLQKHDNKAHEDFSFAFKYALGMFFTTALMTIMVEALKFHNYYTHDFGVIEEETIMFILCTILIPLIWAIHPLQLCHQHSRDVHYGHLDVSQHEANHLMADYHYDMGKRYAEILEMMWFTFLYADLIPIGAFLIFFGFCLYYWVDKYNLLRRSSLEGNISGDLAVKCLFLLDLTLFWRFLGQLIFDIQIRNGATTLTIIFLILSIVYIIIPWESFLELVNSESFKLNQKTFTDQKKRFNYDNYKIYHPIYKEILEHHRKKGGQIELDINDLFLYAKTLPNNPQNASAPQPSQPNSFIGSIAQQFIPNQQSQPSINYPTNPQPFNNFPINPQPYQPYVSNPNNSQPFANYPTNSRNPVSSSLPVQLRGPPVNSSQKPGINFQYK